MSTNIPHFTVENLGKDGDKKLRGWGMVSPAGDLLCPRRQSRQSAAGGGSRAFNNALSRRAPDPHLFYGGATKGQGCIQPARAKDRIPLLTPPAAALCSLNRYLLLQELSRLAFFHRVAVRWLLRLRGWCRIRKIAVNTHLLQVRTLWRFRRPQTYFETGTFRLLPAPGGGGTSNRGDRSPP